jgi:hypothetical protein
LNSEAAIRPIVVGAAGDLADALGGGGGTSFVGVLDGLMTDDMQHVGSFPSYREIDDPTLTIALDNANVNGTWQLIARARWTADNGATRIKNILGAKASSSADLAEILVYAGYAHLYMTDLFGDVPFDGGPLVPQAQVYQRAIDRFTEAITIGRAAGASGTKWVNAALAGRARTYWSLNRLTEAAADAAQVSANFRFDAVFSENSTGENNMYHWANNVRNEVSVSPALRTLYAQTKDPRIAATKAGVGGDGNREWWKQTKYKSYADEMRIAGWQEMELIKAEVAQKAGDLAGAITSINKVRAAVNDPVNVKARPSSTNATEVLDWIKYERQVEFFWEGRRMAVLQHFGMTSLIKHPPFFPIPSFERDTNPNIR